MGVVPRGATPTAVVEKIEMKLTGFQIHGEDTPEDSSPATGLQQALKLAADGWHVFPLRPGSKVPLFPNAHDKEDPLRGRCRGECGRTGHGAHDGTTDPEKIRKWWGSNPNAGIAGNLGDDRAAFDVDLQHGGRYLNAFPETRRHLTGRDNGNGHLIYRYGPDSVLQSIGPKNRALGQGMDLKIGRGAYICLPGTRHPDTGKLYAIDPASPEEHEISDAEVQAIYDEAGVALSATARAASKGISVVKGEPRRAQTAPSGNMLSELLQNPPKRGTGQTNDWLTRVAGHYAKMHRDKRDLYEVEVRRAAQLVEGEPYPAHEIEKTLESIWDTETEQHPERAASINNGWLVGNGRILHCQVSTKEGEETVYSLAPYADFDIQALGVAVTDQGRRAYWLRLLWHGQSLDCTLDGEILGDDRAVRKWLSAFGATIDMPFNAFPKTSPGVRLQRYIESQNPAQVKIADTLGWHADLRVFITHEGVITAEGPATKEEAGIVADPQLLERDIAPYHYGFEASMQEARSVLEEVQSFQDPEVTAVFGAWWAACLLKPQIQTETSIFPFFGIEAASESGKTNGYFALMVALNGNTRGQIAPTKPVLRDSASANRNGIVWADDLDDLTAYGEILRASTSNGTASKMDMDRNGVRNTQIVAPILISGEQLGMSTQKALADRSVVISVPSPTGRMSRHDPSRKQWHDVLALENKYSGIHGLADLAGWFQAAALEQVGEVLEVLREKRGTGKGRHGDKAAVLVAGACLLDFLLGHPGAWEAKGPNARAVELWAQKDEGLLTADNTLTMEVIPWAFRQFHMAEQPEQREMGRFAGIDTPVFIRTKGDPTLEAAGGTEVWISSTLLADAWARDHNHRVDQRTTTKTALQQQADRVCEGGSSRTFKISGTARNVRYRRMLPEYAALVLSRAESD